MMQDKLIEIIDTLGYPIYRQGSMSDEGVHLNAYFTFWCNSSSDLRNYDNQPQACLWDFDLNFYSNDPSLMNIILLEAKTLLKRHDFIIDGKGYDIDSDIETHTGRGINVMYIEHN